MTVQAAQTFASKWLPAWTGNDPEGLLAFYAEDCFYEDAGIPGGAEGKAALRTYFQKLLRQNPSWVWTQLEAIPMAGGFLNKWRADIPVGPKTISIIGVCFVQLNDADEIIRNEVFFDRSELLAEIRALKS